MKATWLNGQIKAYGGKATACQNICTIYESQYTFSVDAGNVVSVLQEPNPAVEKCPKFQEIAEVCPGDYVFIGTASWYRIFQKPQCIYATKLTEEESRVQRDIDSICENADFIATVEKPILPQNWSPKEAILIRMNRIDNSLVWHPNSRFLFVLRREKTQKAKQQVFRLVKTYSPMATINNKCTHSP